MASQDRQALVRSRLIDHIRRVELRVRSVDASLGFYRDIVGLEVAGRDGSRVDLRSGDGPLFLRLDSAGVTAPADPRATGLFHIAIRFPTRRSLGDVLARVAHAGLEVGAGDHLVSEALYVNDPDRNGVELYWDRPVEQWPPPANGMITPMATLPVDLRGLLEGGGGSSAVGAAAPPGTDMGHVHLQVSDVARTALFYESEIGLDLTARMGDEAAFLSSNGYHHHVGANSWRSRGASASDPGRAGLTRVVFAVSADGELDALRARLGGAAGAEGDGSLTVFDPDGIELRFEGGITTP